MVVPAGMDSHSFEPTPADIRLIQNADVLICNGAAMEHWLSEDVYKRQITDRESLNRELERVRDQGYALDEREVEEHMECVGAPVFGPDGSVVGALSAVSYTHLPFQIIYGVSQIGIGRI